ncbi:MAG: response regulator [Lachnospiraceae bacterium]|nr:response regulator [Lachnospiraceae bacterium]
MNQEQYEIERLRSVHLNILVVITLSMIGMWVETFLLDWEYWMPPFLTLGTVMAWYIHIKQRYSLRARLYFYAFVMWAIVVYHGVHSTSYFDLAPVAAIEFAMLAQADERRILRIGLALFGFCFIWDTYQAIMDPTFVFTPLIISRIVLHLCVSSFTYGIADDIIRKRMDDRASDEKQITEQTLMRKRTEDFMANISHELRTPINVVTGLSSVLIDKTPDEAVKDDARHIMSAGLRLTQQVDDILDYHELESGALTITKETFMISSMLNDCLTSLNVYERTGLPQIIVDVDANIPEMLLGDQRRIKKVLQHVIDNAIKFTPAGGIYVNLYQVKREYGINLCLEVEDTGIGMTSKTLERIREGVYQVDSSRTKEQAGFGLGLRIVYGLVHAMNGFVRITSEPEKGTTIHISIPLEVVNPKRCMSVRNAEFLDMIFYQNPSKFNIPKVRDYYFRLIQHVITAQNLTLQRVSTFEDLDQMLKDHQFTHLFTADEEYSEHPFFYDDLSREIRVVVIARQGFTASPDSRVSVIHKPLHAFSLIEILNEYDPSGMSSLTDNAKALSLDGIKALVVDDERMNLVVAKGIFTRYGMDVEVANSGAKAMEMVRQTHYDIIFMYHMLPEMDGVEAYHRIRNILKEQDENSLFVALTANALSGAREMFIKEGFDAFLSKPVVTQELERILKTLL